MATFLVLTLCFFFPAMLSIRQEAIASIGFYIFGLTFIIPAIGIGLFRLSGGITTITMPERRQRIIPFLFISGIYAMVAWLFNNRLAINANFANVMTLVAGLVILATLLTFFLKVSVHALAMSGLVGILLPLIPFSPALLLPVALAILLTGLVSSARLILDAHQPREVYVGWIAGFLGGYLGMVILF